MIEVKLNDIKFNAELMENCITEETHNEAIDRYDAYINMHKDFGFACEYPLNIHICKNENEIINDIKCIKGDMILCDSYAFYNVLCKKNVDIVKCVSFGDCIISKSLILPNSKDGFNINNTRPFNEFEFLTKHFKYWREKENTIKLKYILKFSETIRNLDTELFIRRMKSLRKSR